MTACRDCLEHAPAANAELIVVEGDSAAAAVCAVRDPRLQAVLAMQGKPVNAARAPRARVARSPWLRQLAALLGDAPGTALPLGELRYQRVLILMDPDADGIHVAALLQIFFHECMPVLLEQGRVLLVHPPWAEIRREGAPALLSFHEYEFREQCTQLQRAGLAFERSRFRGLGNLDPALLAQYCVNPATRRARQLGLQDAALARQVFAAGN